MSLSLCRIAPLPPSNATSQPARKLRRSPGSSYKREQRQQSPAPALHPSAQPLFALFPCCGRVGKPPARCGICLPPQRTRATARPPAFPWRKTSRTQSHHSPRFSPPKPPLRHGEGRRLVLPGPRGPLGSAHLLQAVAERVDVAPPQVALYALPLPCPNQVLQAPRSFHRGRPALGAKPIPLPAQLILPLSRDIQECELVFYHNTLWLSDLSIPARAFALKFALNPSS